MYIIFQAVHPAGEKENSGNTAIGDTVIIIHHQVRKNNSFFSVPQIKK